MTAEWLIQWWNLIFIVPFAVAMLYLGLFVVSGLTFGDGDADADVSPDADMDADADISAEADVGADSDADADADVTTDADADADADADHDVEAQADSAIPIYMTALAWLGLGRVPLSILLMALLMGWGLIGFATNFLLWPKVHRTAAEPILPILSMVLAGFGTLLFSATLARLMGRFLPLSETYAHRRHELLGLVGEAMFPIDREFGMAFIRAEQGEVFQAPCRIFSDGQPIEKGAKVRLVAYNARQQVFYVKLAEAEAKQGA